MIKSLKPSKVIMSTKNIYKVPIMIKKSNTPLIRFEKQKFHQLKLFTNEC